MRMGHAESEPNKAKAKMNSPSPESVKNLLTILLIITIKRDGVGSSRRGHLILFCFCYEIFFFRDEKFHQS